MPQREAYGYGHLLTLCNMERAGVLRYAQNKSTWSGVKRQFTLFPEDPEAGRCVSYAYSGYAPLSVRLVELTRSSPKGWRSKEVAARGSRAAGGPRTGSVQVSLR